MKWFFVLLCFFFSFSVQAENSSPWWKMWKTTDETVGVSDNLFTESEQTILRDYLRSQGMGEDREEYDDDEKEHKKHKNKNDKQYKKSQKQKPLPKGLQKKLARGGELPPGWQKKVARGEVLDSDLYAASNRLPDGILDQLENIEGTSVRQVDDRVVRILDSTGIILDVLNSN